MVTGIQANDPIALEQKLEGLKNDKVRLETLIQLGELLKDTEPQKAKIYLSDAMDLALNLSSEIHLAKAQMILCTMFTHSNDYGETLDYCKQAVDYFQKVKNKELLAKTYNAIGIVSDIVGDKAGSLNYLNEALVLFKEIGDKEGEGESYLNIGVCYRQIDDYPTALDYYLKGFRIFESTNNENGIKKAHINLGYIKYHQEYYEKSIFHFKEALKISERQSDASWKSIALEGLAKAYKGSGKEDEALEQANQLVILAEKIGSPYSAASANWVIGSIYMTKGKHLDAADYLLKSLDTTELLGKTQKIDILLNLVAENYLLAENVNAAFPYLRRAKKVCIKFSRKKSLAENYRLYAIYHELNQDFEKALKAQREFMILRDSVFNTKEINLQLKMEKSYQEGKNEMEIEMLSNTVALKESRLKFIKFLMMALGIIFLLVSAFAFQLLKDKHAKKRANDILEEKIANRTQELSTTNHKLEKSNQELERFAYIASHDLKEPLRNISSFVNLIDRKIGKKDYSGLEEYIGFVKKGAQMMNNLINDVLSFSKISDEKIEMTWVDTEEIANFTLKNLKEKILQRHTEISFGSLPEIYAAKSEIIRLFQNLISNGLKYNENECRKIEISYRTQDGFYIFSFKDNGIGIDEAFQEQVFDMFKRLHSRGEYEGTGIGLAACKKIVEKYGGQIWLKSKAGAGTCFSFSFPIPVKNETERKEKLADVIS